ncbi:hypothetical protein CGCF415_v000126 [Colletotrichum fructicola]|nr:hypothetical protein CGCFRS4_v000344 [Colletotrichum fructicola]KAF4917241.1 hypothetical protein CGCF415_v000126 [Colletotrichum fructicola]KAF4942348.1 hypothetical protein CGCF245_v000966 [Colletotrichum fructicola]
MESTKRKGPGLDIPEPLCIAILRTVHLVSCAGQAWWKTPCTKASLGKKAVSSHCAPVTIPLSVSGWKQGPDPGLPRETSKGQQRL